MLHQTRFLFCDCTLTFFQLTLQHVCKWLFRKVLRRINKQARPITLSSRHDAWQDTGRLLRVPNAIIYRPVKIECSRGRAIYNIRTADKFRARNTNPMQQLIMTNERADLLQLVIVRASERGLHYVEIIAQNSDSPRNSILQKQILITRPCGI